MKCLNTLRIGGNRRPWLITIGLVIVFQIGSAWAQEALIRFPFEPSASVVDLDLGVRVGAGADSMYKSGVRKIGAAGSLEAMLRFDNGVPVAIQPHTIAVWFGRRPFNWSFLFGRNASPLRTEAPLSRSFVVRLLSFNSVNGSENPWFPIEESGEFTMDRLEVLGGGSIEVDGSDIESGISRLEDEWSFDLDLSGILRSVGNQLEMTMDFRHTVVVDDSLADASLSLEGPLSSVSEHPYAPLMLGVEWISSSKEVRVFWSHREEFVLQRDTSPTFSNAVSETVLADVREFRFPIADRPSLYFRALRLEEN